MGYVMTTYGMDDEGGFAGDDGYDQAYERGGLNGEFTDAGESKLSPCAKSTFSRSQGVEKPPIAKAEARLEWATTAISAIAYLASLAAILIAVSDSWRAFSHGARFGVLAAILGSTYGLAFFFRKYKRALPASVFFIFGALFLGIALVFVRGVDAANDSDSPELIELFSDGAGLVFALDEPQVGANNATSRDFAGYWAVGVFLLALTLSSPTLHVLTILICLGWSASCSMGYVSPSVLVFSVLGELWAWRRDDKVIAMLYIALGICVVCFDGSVWNDKMAPALATIFAALVYWIGATFKNAIVRGVGLALGGLGLGIMTFPQYWQESTPYFMTRLTAETEVASVDSRVSTTLSLIFCAIFILFAVKMIITGASRSSVRLWFGIGLSVFWLFIFAGVALHLHGAQRGAYTMLFGALSFFAVYEAEKYLERQIGENFAREGDERLPTTDGALDDPEFDDLFDREYRETVKNKKIPVEAAWNRFYDVALEKMNPLALGGTIALQFLFLYMAAVGGAQ